MTDSKNPADVDQPDVDDKDLAPPPPVNEPEPSCPIKKSRFSPTVKGAAIGAVVGSILPVFGTISGAIIGGIAGKVYEKKCNKET